MQHQRLRDPRADLRQPAQIEVLFAFEHDMHVANADRQQVDPGLSDESRR
jgi:hypothetical protein